MNLWLDAACETKIARLPMPHFDEPALTNGPRIGVLHTTEGDWESSMSVFEVHYAPQFIVGVNAHHVAGTRVGMIGKPLHPPQPTGVVEIAQLVPVGTIGAALRKHNNQALVQVEVIGYSDENPWCFSPETLEAVASLMAECARQYDIPLFRPWPDGVYGRAQASDPHRNQGQYGTVAGWFGHGDCPSPDSHWDPGNLQWSKVFSRAKQLLASKENVA